MQQPWRELALGRSGAGLEVLGHGVQQGLEQVLLVARRGFPDRPRRRRRDPARRPPPSRRRPARRSGPVPRPAGSGVRRRPADGFGLPGEGLRQGRSRRNRRCRREAVKRRWLGAAAFDYERGPVLEVWAAAQLGLGRKVGDEDAGGFQAVSGAALPAFPSGQDNYNNIELIYYYQWADVSRRRWIDHRYGRWSGLGGGAQVLALRGMAFGWETSLSAPERSVLC